MSSLIALTPGNYRFMRITILWYICCSETDMRSEEDSAEHSDEQSPQCFMVFAILVQLMFPWFDDGINTSTTSAVRTSGALPLCNAILYVLQRSFPLKFDRNMAMQNLKTCRTTLPVKFVHITVHSYPRQIQLYFVEGWSTKLNQHW